MLIGIDVSTPEEKQQMHKDRWEILCVLEPCQEPIGLTDKDLDFMLDSMLHTSLN